MLRMIEAKPREVPPTLDEIALHGLHRMLIKASEEVTAYLAAHEEARHEEGRRRAVREGSGQVVLGPRDSVGAVGATTVAPRGLGQVPVAHRPGGGAAPLPRVVAASGDAQHSEYRGDQIDGLVLAHPSEDLDGTDSTSRANGPVAYARISRSIRSCRFSQRKRRSPSCSLLVIPSWRRPSFRSAWRTYLRIDWADSPLLQEWAKTWKEESQLPGQLLRPVARSEQLHHLSANLQRVWPSCFRHWELPFRPQEDEVSTKLGQSHAAIAVSPGNH